MDDATNDEIADRARSLVLWGLDTAERVTMSFLGAWGGAWIAVGHAGGSDLLDSTILKVGLVAAVASLVKAVAARRSGDPASASLLPSLHVDDASS